MKTTEEALDQARRRLGEADELHTVTLSLAAVRAMLEEIDRLRDLQSGRPLSTAVNEVPL